MRNTKAEQPCVNLHSNTNLICNDGICRLSGKLLGTSNNGFCCVHTLPKAEECQGMSCNQ